MKSSLLFFLFLKQIKNFYKNIFNSLIIVEKKFFFILFSNNNLSNTLFISFLPLLTLHFAIIEQQQKYSF